MLFNAVVEIRRAPGYLDEEDWEPWMDALAQYAVAVGGTPWDTSDLRICVHGESLAQAAFTACALVKAVTGSDPFAIEIMPQGEFERRNDFPVSV
jgi:hypothetical protein